MKKSLVLILTFVLSISIFAKLNEKERKELRKEFKLYRVERHANNFSMKNALANREIVISDKLRNLPVSSKTAFGSKAWDDTDWEKRKNRKNIQYMGIPNTSRRKAIKKIDNHYVVMFYQAVGNNDDMVEDTFKKVEHILKKY